MSQSIASRSPMSGMATLGLKGYDPQGSKKSASQTLQMTPAKGVQTVNFNAGAAGQQLGSIVTVYVDASDAAVPVEIVMPDTMQTIEVPAYSQGYYPVLTNGLLFNVTAPLIGLLNNSFYVTVQGLNFALPPQSYGPFLPRQNAGVAQSVGIGTGWTVQTIAVPYDTRTDGTAVGRTFQSVEIDCSAFAGNVTLAGTGIDGSLWTVQQLPMTRGEFIIPATATGSSVTATQQIPLGGNTTALIPIRWRVQPCGEATSYAVPVYMPWTTFSWTSLPVGNTTQQAFAAEPGQAVYLDKIAITSAGWGAQFNVSLSDAGYPGGKQIWAASMPSGNNLYSENLGIVTFSKNAALNLIVGNASAATGVLLIALRAALIPSSQNG